VASTVTVVPEIDTMLFEVELGEINDANLCGLLRLRRQLPFAIHRATEGNMKGEYWVDILDNIPGTILGTLCE
jgi:hypothetical protein